MEELMIGGHRLAFVREGEGPPVVFLHNGGTSHAIWLPVMERLRHRHQVIAVDLPGYGQSESPQPAATMDTHVAMVNEFVRRLELKAPILVGNCMGSAISLTHQSRHPGTVRGLVLLNPLTRATLNEGRFGAFLRFRRSMPKPARALHKVAGRLRLPRWSAPSTLKMQLGDSGRRQGLYAQESLVACHASKSQLPSLLSVLDDSDAYAALDAYKRAPDHPPMWVVWGKQNQVLPPQSGTKLLETLRPERVEFVPEGGHLVMLEEPELIARLILEFVSTLDADGSEVGDSAQ